MKPDVKASLKPREINKNVAFYGVAHYFFMFATDSDSEK